MMVIPLRPPTRAKLIAMIGRLWSGRTEPANADAYEAFLRDDLLPRGRPLAGARGAYVLRRDTARRRRRVRHADRCSSRSTRVRAFAGDDVERAVIEPRAQALLAEYDAGGAPLRGRRRGNERPPRRAVDMRLSAARARPLALYVRGALPLTTRR